jgi:hypothetical protein
MSSARTRALLACLLSAVGATAATAAAQPAVQPATAIYVGGDILTMKGQRPAYAEALAVRDGRIAAVGTRAAVMRLKGPGTALVDLKGRTLLPGFIDAHGHVPDYVTTWGLPELAPPPVGTVRSIADLQRAFREHLAKSPPAPGESLVGSGYDDGLLAERRHPTRAELDAVSTELPIVARHASGHLLVANSAAIAKAGITKATKDPEGGVMRRGPDGELDGTMEEQAMLPFLASLRQPGSEEWTRRLVEVQKMYLGHGLTTVGDHLSTPETVANLRRTDAEGKLLFDVVSYPLYMLFDKVLDGRAKLEGIEYFAPGSTLSNMGASRPVGRLAPAASLADPSTGALRAGVYVGRHKIQGIKIAIDGSPQGKTAYLSAPYRVPPPGQPASYRAYPTMTQERMDQWIDAAWRHRVQVAVHVNGDAAAQMMIDAVAKARAKHGPRDLRPIAIHAQTATHAQIERMKQLGIVPSFFTAHTFYWGDWHADETLGPERAARISSLHHAARLGMRYTNHTDSPVVPPDMMHLVWTAVNRESRSGRTIGPAERATPYEALKAITDHAAFQYFEERDKGTLEPGKLADLVILDANPLKVKPSAIRDVKVLETIKAGRPVWQAGR